MVYLVRRLIHDWNSEKSCLPTNIFYNPFFLPGKEQ